MRSHYGPIVERDLCAHTIRVKYSGSQLPTLARQISNRSFKNKPKTSPIFFIWFIISYLLPINEPHIYSLKYIGDHSMEMSIFLSLAYTEILHLKNTWLQFFIYILKWNDVLFEQLYLLEPSMWQYLFLINYKEFKAPQNCSLQPYTEGTCFILRSKTVFSSI